MVKNEDDSQQTNIWISKVIISNFKGFRGKFELSLSKGTNILVGANDAGKSTILEAINLALTGTLGGRYIRNEISQYLFNKEVVAEYLDSVEKGAPIEPPVITIDVYLEGEESDIIKFRGKNNFTQENKSGFSYKIMLDTEKHKSEYNELIGQKSLKSLPVEFYDVVWSSFADSEPIVSRAISCKPAMIESVASRMQNGSDYYISRIVKDYLEDAEKVNVSQAHRNLRETFNKDDSIKNINSKLSTAIGISDKNVSLSVDLATKNAWEASLITMIDEVPFHHIGKGEQSIIKTRLALSHKKTIKSPILLIEEPENHLTHANLNLLLKRINEDSSDKQAVITTHHSFVANKLGLDNLILLNKTADSHSYATIGDLDDETIRYFQHIAGYDTLRLVLAEKAILVEGDADELVVQKAYMQKHNGNLPIENGIDVISVGTAFERFLDVAVLLKKPVAIVTDNDGDIDNLAEKYKKYDKATNIFVSYGTEIDSGKLTIGKNNKPFNYNTLEPKLVKVNTFEKTKELLGSNLKTVDELHRHMRANKTECALRIFESKLDFKPTVEIENALNWIDNDGDSSKK